MSQSTYPTNTLQTPPASEQSYRYVQTPLSKKEGTSPLEDQSTVQCDATQKQSWWGPSAMLLDDSPSAASTDTEIYRRVRHGLLLHPAGMHMFIMPSHFKSATCHEINELRRKISLSGGMFARDVQHAKLIITKVWRENRARLDLRTCGILTEAQRHEDGCYWNIEIGSDTVSVVNVEWLEDSWKAGHILSMNDYVVHHGRVIPAALKATTTTT